MTWWRLRPVVNLAIHLALFAVVNYAAFWLRFGGSIPASQSRYWLVGLPILLGIRLVVFEYLHLFDGVWIYTDIWDLRSLTLATAFGSAVFLVCVELTPLRGYDPSAIVIDALGVLTVLGGIRLLRRGRHGLANRQEFRRVIIYGAGDAGAMIAREMKSKPEFGSHPIGFLDDDPSKDGQYVHGLRVLGGRSKLDAVIARSHPDEVVLAMPSVAPKVLRGVVMALEPYSVVVRMLPSLAASVGASLGAVRQVSAEDLLERPQVLLDVKPIRAFISGKRVLVTGAGGSIGSELIRQIAQLEPAALIALDRYENGLFAVEQDVRKLHEPFAFSLLVADITDERRIQSVFTDYSPSVVFHAAAHKHVPLMEANPCEAVKNNVRGTRIVAEAAKRNHCSHFILISTDKAVNPMSVMGATKRAAESIVQSLASNSETVFASVRFGNVLGSSGSVVPLFTHQIKQGGPVTVTHADARRYFMLIPEAVQLVLHAASIAQGGEVYALEMGEQIAVLDVARDLIRLSGARPDRDVSITFTGLRPGEKVTEELAEHGETLESAGRQGIMRIRPVRLGGSDRRNETLILLEQAALVGDSSTAIRLLGELVPTYAPEGEQAGSLDGRAKRAGTNDLFAPLGPVSKPDR